MIFSLKELNLLLELVVQCTKKSFTKRPEEEPHCSVNTAKGPAIQWINVINYMDIPTTNKVEEVLFAVMFLVLLLLMFGIRD